MSDKSIDNAEQSPSADIKEIESNQNYEQKILTRSLLIVDMLNYLYPPIVTMILCHRIMANFFEAHTLFHSSSKFKS